MEKLVFRPENIIKKTIGRVGSRVLLAGMSLGGAGVAHQFVNPQIAEAADCKGAIRLTVREFQDVGGVKKQYDSIIDKALNPIPDTNVKFSTSGKPIDPVAGIKADKDGKIETPTFTAPCTTPDGKKMEVLAEGTTADGRKVADVLIVQDGKREIFKLWVAQKEEPAAPTAIATVVRTPGATRTPATITPTATRTAYPDATPSATSTPQPTGMSLDSGRLDPEVMGKLLLGAGALSLSILVARKLVQRFRRP